ncbi:zf-HC2 domain-containing protein [Simiduia aestuariiviva]|uniref:Anti-sigma factor RsiW n=1 Tax=Simiduia aestuariiviva TaxID=1510459 RepID=A0A839UN69_9GAMM|nr:zf-HC2 domain-containing protein [Simiduia aestuariiviva]MBB3169614.1 anti-sigma factor RsiW [Simiduia aestuariiviva]
MLKCKDIVARSSDYLDGELTSWARINYRVHLMMCTHCRRYLRHFRIAIQAAARVARTGTDPVTAEQISESVQRNS